MHWSTTQAATVEEGCGGPRGRTSSNEALLKPDPTAVATRAELEAHYPLGRGGQPEEVAALVVALLGQAGSFVSGTIILVDGGISALLESPVAPRRGGGPPVVRSIT